MILAFVARVEEKPRLIEVINKGSFDLSYPPHRPSPNMADTA